MSETRQPRRCEDDDDPIDGPSELEAKRARASLYGNDSTPPENIDAFLRTFQPTKWKNDQLQWIDVFHDDPSRVVDMEPWDVDTITDEFKTICLSKKPNASDVKYLALKYDILGGKWMVFCKTHQVDSLWETIARAVLAGRLGRSAKVSPPGVDDDQVILVYADDYTDETEVMRIREVLRDLGVLKRIPFKPDIFTCCGVFGKNPYGISTAVFHK